MPEGADPLTSLGFLVAASLVTLFALVGYAISLVRRLRAAEARNSELQNRSR